jgi:hypothetical protein
VSGLGQLYSHLERVEQKNRAMAKAYFVVRAEVLDEADRAAFDTGMPPTIYPSRSGLLPRSAAGGAGAEAIPRSTTRSTSLPMSGRRKRCSVPNGSGRWSPISIASGATG